MGLIVLLVALFGGGCWMFSRWLRRKQQEASRSTDQSDGPTVTGFTPAPPGGQQINTTAYPRATDGPQYPELYHCVAHVPTAKAPSFVINSPGAPSSDNQPTNSIIAHRPVTPSAPVEFSDDPPAYEDIDKY